MIAVSAVSLLLIVTLTTVTLTQCLLIIRMRRSRDRSETYAVATNSTTKTTDVPVSLNEAYELTKITTEEVTYELELYLLKLGVCQLCVSKWLDYSMMSVMKIILVQNLL